MDANFNYIFKCWHDFTVLTEEERINLAKLQNNEDSLIESSSDRIRCVDTGEIFDNPYQAAHKLGVHHATIYTGLKIHNGVHRLRNGYLIERI